MTSPRFSPEGNRIAFRSNRAGSQELCVCNADGSNAAKLTSLGGLTLGPSWSADSRHLTFGVILENSVHIQVVNAAEGPPRSVVRDSAIVRWIPPNWSRDGKWIYFASRRTGEAQSWKAPVAGGAAAQVTREDCRHLNRMGKFVYYLKEPPARLWRGAVGRRRRKQPIGELGSVRMSAHPGAMAVSPDGQVLVFARPEARGADLMLVENLHLSVGTIVRPAIAPARHEAA
jgi:hypothetical protein